MKTILLATVAIPLLFGAAQAQSMNKEPNGSMSKQNSPGTTGAMGNVTSNGIATDPTGVAAQQGAAGKNSAGTVGAAPGGDTGSQKPQNNQR